VQLHLQLAALASLVHSSIVGLCNQMIYKIKVYHFLLIVLPSSCLFLVQKYKHNILSCLNERRDKYRSFCAYTLLQTIPGFMYQRVEICVDIHRKDIGGVLTNTFTFPER
jgi:hypothetical protein